jgi:integrase
LWTIPAARTKSDEPHVVPLSPAALELLRALPRGRAYVIGNAPIHYSRAKRLLDARMTELNGKAIPHFTWHDLRRSFRTGLSTIGVPPHIAELCIAHRQQGLAKVYDLHRFNDEKRAAFTAWERRLLSIAAG